MSVLYVENCAECPYKERCKVNMPEIRAFVLNIYSLGGGYGYHVSFFLDGRQEQYMSEGSAASPTRCFDLAMEYLNRSLCDEGKQNV